MPKQAGPYAFEGTVGKLTGYKMNGEYYLRAKSSLPPVKISKKMNQWNGRSMRHLWGIYGTSMEAPY